MTTSAVLAVFDELNVNSFVIQDKSHRPGVSISFTTHMLQHAQAGETVCLTFKTDKIGKIVYIYILCGLYSYIYNTIYFTVINLLFILQVKY